MYDLEKFKNGKCYIRLETQEKYNKVMKWLESKDILWSSGDTATTLNYYPNYRGNLSIVFRGGLKKDSEGFYTKYGYKELLPNKEEKEMKYKINDIVKTEFGVGKIVYVDNLEPSYLVHIDGFDGHRGYLAGPAIQDNYNNWWFYEECLELVKRNDNKYKVGDKVRLFGKGKIKEIIAINEVFGYRTNDNNYYIDEELELVIDDYITTKDFIKEVEKLGYDVEIEQGIEINVTDGHFEISIYIEESDYLNIEYFGNVKNISPLLKLIIKYLETPIEFREEPKKYTLELPNTTIKARYFRFGLPHAKHSYKFGALPKSATNSDIDYQAYFTQKEIDDLPNQELIKLLKKEPVK